MPPLSLVIERCQTNHILVDEIDWKHVNELYMAPHSVENLLRLMLALFFESCTEAVEVGEEGAQLLLSLAYTLVPSAAQTTVDVVVSALRGVTGASAKTPLSQLSLKLRCVRPLQLQNTRARHIALLRDPRLESEEEEDADEELDGDGNDLLVLQVDEIEITAAVSLTSGSAIVSPCATLVALFTYSLHHARVAKVLTVL
jgi:hypothetical protein